jgi:uncharacterized protein
MLTEFAEGYLANELRDPIHGFIRREDLERDIIDCPIFQRLRKIKQLAMASLVYPGAIHSRFEHSVGAMHVAGRIAQAVGLPPHEIRLARLAALLHDIGHGPFSHVSEPILQTFALPQYIPQVAGQQLHEVVTAQIIMKDKNLSHLLSGQEREQITGILNGTWGDTILKDIVSGPIDADKQDYLLRDSYFCGVKYGLYDLDRLIEILRISDDGSDRYLAITADGDHVLEQFVLAKYYMTTQVYRHKIRLISDAMIERALTLGIQVDGIQWLKELFTFDGSEAQYVKLTSCTDENLINEILSAKTPDGSYVKNLFVKLRDRHLHKRIASYKLARFSALVRESDYPNWIRRKRHHSSITSGNISLQIRCSYLYGSSI